MIKRLLYTLTATLACATASYGQISVGSTGVGPITFDSQPPASEWSTRTVAGGAGDVTLAAQMDTAVSSETAAGINTQLPSVTGAPPAASTMAQYVSDGHFLITRPTTVRSAIIMGTFRNDSGSPRTALTLSYDLTSLNNVTEELLGHRVYYSLSGQANEWVNIAAFNGNRTSGNRSTAVDLSANPWNAGANLYLLWVDDNGSGSPDDANEIDNVTIGFPPVGIVITTPANNASFAAGSPVTISATAVSEGTITSVDFKDGANIIQTDSTAPYSISTTTLSIGSHTLTAVSHDSLGNTHISPAITITIHANVPPVISALTNDLAATSMYVGSNVTYTAVATDDGTVTNVEFRVDGATRWNDTTSPYTYAWCDMTAGTHTVSAVASDDLGAKTTNSVSITVTNPPGITVLLANGQLWKYWDEGVDPGATWKDIGYNDTGWSNGIAEIGYGDTDANRPEITISRKIVGTPGSPTAITNATQLFRRHFTVPNPSSFTGIVVRAMIDDGAVIYFNGTEVARNANILAGQTYASYASATMADDGVLFNEFNVPTSAVVAGDNLVAVEVHQQSITSSDISFDLMIWGKAPPAPRLAFTPVGDGTYDLSWPTGLPKYCVQYKTAVTDTWNDIGICHPDPDAAQDPGVGGRYSMNIDPAFFGPVQFFRLAPGGN